MQRLDIVNHLQSVLIQLVGRTLKLLGRLDMRCIQRHLHLCQEMLLGHLVRVHLQTESIQSYLLQTLLHHFQSRHLFSYKQHPLALIQCVGYHVGDGL